MFPTLSFDRQGFDASTLEAMVLRAAGGLQQLGDELRAAGLNMRAFSVVHGARPSEVSDWTPSGRGLVVDVSA